MTRDRDGVREPSRSSGGGPGDGADGSAGGEGALAESRTPAEGGGAAPDASPAVRPGVPREAPAADGEKREAPARQEAPADRLRRAGLDGLTPVVGTAQPPRGLSGALRGAAYGIPEHRARHWMLLMVADRVDVLEGRLGRGLARAAGGIGLGPLADRLQRNPLPAAAGVLAGTLLAGWLVSAARRRTD